MFLLILYSWGRREYGNTGIRDVTFVLSPSCVPPVASDQRSSGLLVFFHLLFLYYIYAREGANYFTSFSCEVTSVPFTLMVKEVKALPLLRTYSLVSV